MFEVLNRNGMARVGKWTYKEQEITTPVLAFVESDRINAPEEAEIFLKESEVEGKASVIIPRFGFLKPRAELDDVAFVRAGIEALKGFEPKELVIIDNCIEFLQNPLQFAEFIIALREKIGHQRLIYVPGLAAPWNLALLSYIGIDLFDSSRLVLESRTGNFLTTDGRMKKEERRTCYCKGCQITDGYESLLFHNYYATLGELELVKKFIRENRLRELVESRALAEEWAFAVLKHLDLRFYDAMETEFPVSARSGLKLKTYSAVSLNRPDIVRFRRRLDERYVKPPNASILVLIPCSARKPYHTSKTHRRIRRALADLPGLGSVHFVVVTSPLGLVPKELDVFYPAQNYDIPVTGDWSRDEKAMLSESLKKYLAKNKYDKIIVHLGSEEKAIREIFSDMGVGPRFTCFAGNATSDKSLENLKEVLLELTQEQKPPSRAQRNMEDVMNIARFQFGELGDDLLKDAKVKGNYPHFKIVKDEIQLAILSAERGMLSLTFEGAKALTGKGYRVEIEDFQPQSTVFAVGIISADDKFRIGDEVVVIHGNEVRGVGVAAMNPKEMVESNRGIAVKVRHHI
jgi:archaeosine synthase